MMQQRFSLSMNQEIDGSSLYEESSLGKRKLAFPGSFDVQETRMNKKKRKRDGRMSKVKTADSSISFSTKALPDPSVFHSDDDDVFEWMENILGGGNDESKIPTKKQKGSAASIPSKNDTEIDSLLTLNESDPCYEEMFSLLAQDDNDHNNTDDENFFKKIQESFVHDRLPECHDVSCTKSRPDMSVSKKMTLQRSPSFNTRQARSSRIGIRAGYDNLVKANRLSAKTRYMLLTCKPSFLNARNSQ